MILPLWRSLYSLNLMLPKEERRAMLLRLFNDETPLLNTTQKRQQEATNGADNGGDIPSSVIEKTKAHEENLLSSRQTNEGSERPPTPKEEENAIKRESLLLGQGEQDAMNSRESYVVAGEEEDTVNNTV